MIQQLEKELEQIGFIQVGSSREPSYVRKKGLIRTNIWEEFNKDEDGTRINVYIQIEDQFSLSEEKRYVTVLDGSLHEKRIVLPARGQGSGRYWKNGEEKDALDALLKYGTLWMDVHDEMSKLISIFEEELKEGVKTANKREKALSWISKALSRQSQSEEYIFLRKPPINHYYLSLLYVACDNKSKACEHAQEWLLFCKTKIKLSDEPERTMRQIETMKC